MINRIDEFCACIHKLCHLLSLIYTSAFKKSLLLLYTPKREITKNLWNFFDFIESSLTQTKTIDISIRIFMKSFIKWSLLKCRFTLPDYTKFCRSLQKDVLSLSPAKNISFSYINFIMIINYLFISKVTAISKLFDNECYTSRPK